MTAIAVSVRNLSKHYGSIAAVNNISFDIEQGTIFGLLGPNGAGKTTLIRILTTLTRPSSGDALVEGHSVMIQGLEVRRIIGVVPQTNNLDRYLTARENLVLHAQLHGMPAKDYHQRIDELLELTGLTPRQHDHPDTFSGGMQRRLVVARALLHGPKVLFLDEPTTGLDPQSRRAVWDYISRLRRRMTIFLTTHYMEEADSLCDRIVIMDEGKSLVDGSAAEIKARGGKEHAFIVSFHDNSKVNESLLRSLPFVLKVERFRDEFKVEFNDPARIREFIMAFDPGALKHFCLKEPTLEDVFIQLTGRELRD